MGLKTSTVIALSLLLQVNLCLDPVLAKISQADLDKARTLHGLGDGSEIPFIQDKLKLGKDKNE